MPTFAKQLRAELESAKRQTRLAQIAVHRASTEADKKKCLEKYDEAAAAEAKLLQALEDLPSGAGGGELPDDFAPVAQQASLRRYLAAAASGNPLSGAEREVNAELLGAEQTDAGGTLIPFAVLDPALNRAPAMYAADASTAGPVSTAIPAVQRGLIQRVFARSICAFLGVEFPQIERGAANYIAVTSGVSPEVKAAGAAKDAEAATFTTASLEPKRLTARYRIRVEDIARVNGYEDGLRRDLTDALADKMDERALNSTNDIDGFFDMLADAVDPAAEDTFESYAAKAASGVDGKFAGDLTEVKLAVGAATFRHMAAELAMNTSRTVLDYFAERTGGLRASANMPAAVATGNPVDKIVQGGLLYRAGGMGGPDAVAPVWNGIEVIRDPYSAAGNGEVILTAHMLWNFAMTRKAAYAEIKARTK